MLPESEFVELIPRIFLVPAMNLGGDDFTSSLKRIGKYIGAHDRAISKGFKSGPWFFKQR